MFRLIKRSPSIYIVKLLCLRFVHRKMNDAFRGVGVVDDGNRRPPVHSVVMLGYTGVVVRPRPVAAVGSAAHSSVGRGHR